MPVYKLTNEMPYDELLRWMNYFERRPIGWREDNRTHKLMQVQGCDQPAVELFPSLQPIFTPAAVVHKDGMLPANFKGSLMFMKMLQAKGGDKVDL